MQDIKISLNFTSGHFVGRKIELNKKAITLGRSTTATLRLNDPEVSGEHALLTFAESGWTIKDLNSANGVIVNGTKIVNEQSLSHLDKIEVCSEVFLFELPGHELAIAPDEDGESKALVSTSHVGLISLLSLMIAVSLIVCFIDFPKADMAKEANLEQVQELSEDTLSTELIKDQIINEVDESEFINPIIKSSPMGAEIELDGVLVGKTPFQIQGLKPGLHMLSLVKNKYYGVRQIVDIQNESELHWDLELNQDILYLKTTPEQAKVYNGDKLLGQTPLHVYKGQITHEHLLVQSADHADYEALLSELTDGLNLDGQLASLYVSSKLGALKLKRDGTYLGELKAQERKLFHGLTSGDYSIEASLPNAKNMLVKNVRLEPGQNSSISFSLFSISHKIEMVDGSVLYGMLLNRYDDSISFAISEDDIKTIPNTGFLNVSKSSKADQFGIKEGLEVSDERIRTLNPNIWMPRSISGAKDVLDTQKPLELTSSELSAHYAEKSLIEFQTTYGGASINISGTVKEIRMNDDWYTLNLDDFIECFFRRGDVSELELEKYFGKRVTVNGYSVGVRGLDLFILTECKELK